ncbi:MAG TPA: hypothetical protein VGQ83_15050, partial [Polyangia bacterium]
PDAAAVAAAGGAAAATDGARPDAGADAGAPADASADAGAGADAAPDGSTDTSPATDAPAADAAPADAAPADAAAGPRHVDIYITNFCETSVVPTSITVPAGETLLVDFHNNSVDYNADVWCSWGGGFLDLPTGQIWHDPIPFCSGPSTYDAYADISIAGGGGTYCPGVRFVVHCL